jgi:hypothetical protein
MQEAAEKKSAITHKVIHTPFEAKKAFPASH